MAASLSETRARDAARKALRGLWVRKPEHIELDLFAAQCGLTVTEGGLETAEGRIVAGPANRGYIRYRSGIQSPGRRRFIVGHELGHFYLHKRQSYTDTSRELCTYGTGNLETEANVFAAELLMPDFLFTERIKGAEPSHQKLQSLSAEFSTSHLATIIQYLAYTREPCALVFSKAGVIQWTRKSDSWEWFVQDGNVHPHSGAGEYFSTGKPPQAGMIDTPAGAWLTQFSINGHETIREDVFVWPEHKIVLSLLWVDDDL